MILTGFSYLSLTFLHILTVIFLIVNFVFDNEIHNKDKFQQGLISGILGFLLAFIYTCILPLKIAKGITEQKLKTFNRHALDPNTHSFVGTVVGVLLGGSFIFMTILFSNLNFVMKGIYTKFITNEISITSVCIINCAIVLMAIAVLYKEIKRELLKFNCIRKCFPKRVRSYTISHVDEA